MSFYNLYQQGPAVGQGAEDLVWKIAQIIQAKRMGGNLNQQPPQQPMIPPQMQQQPQTGLMGQTAGVGFDPMASRKKAEEEAEEKRKMMEMMQYIMMMTQGVR